MRDFDCDDVAVEPWLRTWEIGPSDSAIHAIGQIVCNCSMLEWITHDLFVFAIGDKTLASALLTKIQYNRSNEPNFLMKWLDDPAKFHRGASLHAIDALKRLSHSKEMRNSIVHWITEITNDGDNDDVARFTNLFRPQADGTASTKEFSLTELRQCAHDLATIIRDLAEAKSILVRRSDDLQQLRSDLEAQEASREISAQSQRLLSILRRTT